MRQLLAAFVFLVAASAAAQDAPVPSETAERAQALIEALRDDAAREALLSELERLAAGAEEAAAAPEADAPEDATPEAAEDSADGAASGDGPTGDAAPEVRSMGARLARASQAAVADLVAGGRDFVNSLAATQRRLSALWGGRSSALADALVQVAATAAVAIAVFILARRLVSSALTALPEGARLSERVVNGVAALLLDAIAIGLGWAAGYVVATAFFGEAGEIAVGQSLFLNAFLISQICKLPLRALLAPTDGRVRIAPMSDRGARAWFRRLSLLVDFIAYAVLFAAPLVGITISVFTGRAVLTVAQAGAAIWAMALVVRHREAPERWLKARAAAGEGSQDATMRVLRWAAAIWHWPALIWLLTVFVASVTRSGAVAPLLTGTGAAILIAILGAMIGAGLGALARRGVALPARFAESAPMLEPRINAFLRRGLNALRLIILVVTVAAALNAAGLFDFEAWVAASFGGDFIARLISAALVIAGATLLWLVLASWVDLRLARADANASARAQTLLTLLRNAITVALVLLAGMIALSELGLDIGPLLASAGVLGLAIGFGAQKLVQDVITGVFIQLENAINVGDVVTAGGVSGVAEKLTIRSVSLRDLQGVLHVIPFSSVDMVSNFMKGFAFHVADLGIAYREDTEEGKAVMHAAFDELKKDPAHRFDIIGELEWFGVNELGDSAVTLRARIRTRPGKQWGIGRAYNGLLKKHCDARGVEIPFPHLTLWFGEDKAGGAPPARIEGRIAAEGFELAARETASGAAAIETKA